MYSKRKHRYPGIRFFETEEKRLFFGRKSECRDLFSMLKVKPIVVLFAKSGIGKSSLINAGLIPLLEKDLYQPVRIRFQDTNFSPGDLFRKTLEPFVDQSLYQRHAREESPDVALWEYIKACRFGEKGTEKIPVLIFDQFEEFFNHPVGRQQELVGMLANLVNNRLPDAIQQRLREIPRRERTQEQFTWFSPVSVKVLLSIRSDRMSFLDELSVEIPTILHNRFHLKPLKMEQAEEAIKAPAILEDEAFWVKPFTYEVESLKEILGHLSNDMREIESVQLQILCQHIEREVKKRQKSPDPRFHMANGMLMVNTEYYGGKHGIDKILNDYYEREIAKIGDEKEQGLVRRFIEEALIIESSRVSVSHAGAINQYNLTEDLLSRLRESRLIRAENTHLGKAYEVSHDTLVTPILKSYEERKQEEELFRAAEKVKAEHIAFQKERKKRRRAVILAALGFLLFFIALIALYEAIKLNREAEVQTRIAKSNELTSHSIFEIQKNNNVTMGFGLVKQALEYDDNTEARKGLFSAYYKGVGVPANYFYTKDLNCKDSKLLSAYYSPLGSYTIVNAWNGEACLFDQEGTLIRSFTISAFKPVCRSVFSPDEKYLLTLDQDNTVKVWDLATLTPDAQPSAVLKRHNNILNGAHFSSDGQRVMTYDIDGLVVIWNSDWQKEMELQEDSRSIRYAGFSPDGQHILTILANGDILIWDQNGLTNKKIQHPNGSTYVVSCSPDSNYFAVASKNFVTKVWDWSGRPVTVLKGHKNYIFDIDWSPDGKYLATASPDKTAKIWNLNGEIIASIEGHHASVLSVDFSPDGMNLLTASVDNTSKIWDLEGNLIANLSGHYEKVNLAVFHPEGEKILSFSEEDKTVKEWIKEESPVIDLGVESEEVFISIFSPDGKKAMTCGSKIGMLWDISKGYKQVSEIAKLTKHKNGIYAAAFTPQSDLVATASLDHTAKIWDMNGALVADLIGHTTEVRAVNWSPDGQRVITASYDNTAKVWDRNGRLLFSLEGHREPVMYAAYSPDGNRIITTSADFTAKLWDNEGGLITTFEGHRHLVVHAAFSPVNDYVVTVSEDKTGRIWPLDDETRLGESIVLEGHRDVLMSVDVSPDGRQILTASEDRTARIWNRKGDLLQSLIGHENRVLEAVFSPDGKFIATASSDNTAKIWSPDGTLISDLIGHNNTVNDVSFSPIKKIMITAGSDHQAKIWPLLNTTLVKEMLESKGIVDLNDEMKRKYKITN